MQVVALDVETANSSRGSICALSVVSRAFGARTWLVRPEPCYFAPVNVGIHGIREEHVANAPTIHEVFRELAPLVRDVTVVAHNASFDIGALVASARASAATRGDSPEQRVVESLAPPDLNFTCSLAIARRAWPNLSAFDLYSLCAAFGIDLTHHDATSDAWASLAIVERALVERRCATLDELHAALGLATHALCRWLRGTDRGSAAVEDPSGDRGLVRGGSVG
jgi:DNA polymerase-3 subunit epsilon